MKDLQFETRLMNKENFDKLELMVVKERMANELLRRRVAELEAWCEDRIQEEKYVIEDLQLLIETMHSIRRIANSDLRNNDLMKIYVNAKKALEVVL